MTAQKHDTKVISLTLSTELLNRVEDYRFKHRFPTRLEAIRFLLDYGVRHDPDPGGWQR